MPAHSGYGGGHIGGNGDVVPAEAQAKAWFGAIEFPLRGRPAKPRDVGLTMVIDKGLGIDETRALLEVAADYIDFIKLAFGTSVFFTPEQLREKVRLIHEYGVEVYPGGTLLEIAMVQNRLEAFDEQAQAIGFRCLEVSDGTVAMNPRYRERLIRELVRRGFRVVSEVGKKHPADRLPNMRVREQILEDLEAGAYKVIVEGRESGKGVVIYHSDGSIDQDELEFLASAVPDPGVLIWEAPLKNQQQDLILLFGPAVNLGNIHPQDVISLEALRVGLRGDTLRSALLSRPQLLRVRPTWPPAVDGSGSEDWI
ncbi:MAG TPA: phosphosulfolactate synthase [Bacillota bacterium]